MRNISLITILAFLFTVNISAEVEISGFYKNESAINTESGVNIGDYENDGTQNSHDNDDVLKSEHTLKLFINGDLGSDSSYHVELNAVADTSGVDSYYKGYQPYTQRDILREAYIDIETNAGWLIRAGKQQVVWGTVDGAKLLDMINPTDYSEMAQNSMEDSRITTWMLNAEKDTAAGNFQIVVSQARENIFAGLNRDINTDVRANNATTGADETQNKGHNQGHPFMMKGVDTITGKRNGFLNGVPDLGSIALGFAGLFTPAGLAGSTGVTVGEFANSNAATVAGMGIPGGGDGAQTLAGYAGNYDFNLSDATSASAWSADSNPNSMFEYMDRTPFSTFNTFVNAKSKYEYDMPNEDDLNLAFRLNKSLDSGLNYSLNYSYNYDPNPVINLYWTNDAGEKLTVVRGATYNTATDKTAGISLQDSDGNNYGATFGNSAILVFEQTLERAHNAGVAFDYALDTQNLGPVVLKGEFLYQKDVYSPIFDRGKLAIGDLAGALKMNKGDRFKYALGADITVMTNMMVSAQFIQDRNLDYVDDNKDFDGSACTAAEGANCGIYTGDFATMHMSNGFQKAKENKEFYSLFLSKPFGDSAQHRWNNLFMYEDQGEGGMWNRFDIEYVINDDAIATFEWNEYFGEENSQFGQLNNSSNIQVGFKILF